MASNVDELGPEEDEDDLDDVVAQIRAKQAKGDAPSSEDLLALYKVLGRPSAREFARQLQRRLGMRVTEADAKRVTELESTRQILAPPPRYNGKIFSLGLDDRWVSDIAVFSAGTVRYALFVQDVFSRFLWVRPMASQAAVIEPMREIMRVRRPRVLFTDADTAYTSQNFKALMEELGVTHRIKTGRNDIATVDRAMAIVKETVIKEMNTKGDKDWTKFLRIAVRAFNGKSLEYLMNEAPEDVKEGTQLEFMLERKNLGFMERNVRLLAQKTNRLTDKGFFRNYVAPPRTKGWRRTGDPRWNPTMHRVERIDGSLVFDENGKSYPIKEVLPVEEGSTELRLAAGLNPAQQKNKAALTDVRDELVSWFHSQGIDQASFRKVNDALKDKTDYYTKIDKLRISRVNAVERLAALFPENFEVIKGGTRNVLKLIGT